MEPEGDDGEAQELVVMVGTKTDRGIDVFTDTVGDTITPAVTTLLTAAAVVTKNPELAVLSVPAGAFAGALGKQGALVAAATIRERIHRVTRFINAAEEAADEKIEDFIAKNVDDDEKWTLLGATVDAATDSRSAWRIKVLARAFVRGAQEGDRVDETHYFIPLLRELDPAHARLLAIVQDNRHEVLQDIKGYDPKLGSAVAVLLRQLVSEGFVDERTGSYSLSGVGEACADWLAHLGFESKK